MTFNITVEREARVKNAFRSRANHWLNQWFCSIMSFYANLMLNSFLRVSESFLTGSPTTLK